MPFPMKIQPLDTDPETLKESVRTDSSAKPVLKSRLRRLFDRQFPSVLRISSAAEKTNAVGEPPQYTTASAAISSSSSNNHNKDGGAEYELSSVCLAKMVQNFIEETNEKQPAPAPKCGRNRCNCFNANSNDSSDDEFDFDGLGDSMTASGSYGGDASDMLKTLIPCVSVAERNLLADTAKIVEKNKNQKREDDMRTIVTDSLSFLGYDASICKSKWEKSSSFPAGEYEYIDVIVEGERLLIDIEFRSEFEIARSTGTYKAILQSLPYIFVGKSDRLGQIVSIVSEAAKQSLKKKGMHFPPWRKADYMRAKWLSPSYTRTQPPKTLAVSPSEEDQQLPEPEYGASQHGDDDISSDCGGDLELIFGDKSSSPENVPTSSQAKNSGSDEDPPAGPVCTWHPPAVKPKSLERGAKIVTGLASLLKDKP